MERIIIEDISDTVLFIEDHVIQHEEQVYHESYFPSAAPTAGSTSTPTIFTGDLVTSTDTEIIKGTLRLYGSIYVGIFLLFCFVRRRYPKLYNLRGWVPEMKNDLAAKMYEDYGFFSWAWEVFNVDDDTLLHNCGMDALCFVRSLRLGAKLCSIGVFNCFWLIPMYLTAEDSPETAYLQDPFVKMSVANLPSASTRFVGVVLAAYMTHFYSLKLITEEHDWFVKYRHKFLSLKMPRNYAIYVSGIPEHLRSDYALGDFFRETSSEESILAAHIAMDIPSLEAKVARRKVVIEKLEHAIALEKLKGTVKTHRTFNLQNTLNPDEQVTEVVKSVDAYRDELRQLNKEIATGIGEITNQNDRMRRMFTKGGQGSSELQRAGKGIKSQLIVMPASPPGEGTPQNTLDSVQYKMSSLGMDLSDDEDESGLKVISESSPQNSEGNHAANNLSVNDSMQERPDPTEGKYSASEVIERWNNAVSYFDSPNLFLQLLGLEQKSLKMDELSEHSITTGGTHQGSSESDRNNEDSLGDKSKKGNDKDENNHTNDKMESNEGPAAQAKTTMETSDAASDLNDSHSSIQIVSLEEMEAGTMTWKRNPPNSDTRSVESSRRGRRRRWTQFGDTPNGSTKTINSSGDSVDSSKSRWLRNHAAKSVSRLGHNIRASVALENVSDGVKKVGQIGVQGAIKAKDGAIKAKDMGMKGAIMAAEFGKAKIQQAPELASQIADAAAAIAPMLRIKGDGTPREGGFVVFRNLHTTHAAIQMLHNASSSEMIVEAAPSSSEIFWPNVGLPLKARKTGFVFSAAATVTLCFFWSIPIAFLSSLTEVNSLKQKLPLLGELVEKYPYLESFLALIAPLILLLLNEGILPSLLNLFSKWEGLVGAPQLEASTFVKLSTFVVSFISSLFRELLVVCATLTHSFLFAAKRQIVQTFFVSAISGSITAEIANILDNPELAINLLANSLPTQSSYFIQIALVFTFLLQGIYLLRVYPLSHALFRRLLGPNLTEKERRRKWKLLKPLEDPPEFVHAEIFAQVVLFFVSFFVYAPIAPISCVFLCGSFIVCESGYRYHFIHNNKTHPDSGGRIWKGFSKVIGYSILIGQFTLIGFLALKKAVYAVPALTPLPVFTILFMIFIWPKKIHASNHLPTMECVRLDRERVNENLDFLKNKYIQPALLHRRLHADENVV